MQGNTLRLGDSGPVRQKPVVSRFVDSVRDRDGQWVMRFGRGLGMAALISGLLWGAIVLVFRAVL